MADDIRLVIGVEQSGLLKAITNTESLEKKVKKLSDAYARDAVSYGRYNKAIGDLATATKKSKKELLDYGKALRADEQATKQATLATKQFAQARKDAIAEDQRRTAEAKKATQAAAQQSAEEERLKNKFVQGYTAASLYSKELNDLGIARKRGIISIEQQRVALDRLNKEYAEGSGRFAMYANAMGKSANRAGVAMQQTGYQVGDFLVQVQSGTNPMVAFGQQATQLVGVLYLLPQATLAAKVGFMGLQMSMGAIIAVVSIAVPLITAIGAYFMRAKEAADKAKSSFMGLADALQTVKEETADLNQQLQMLRAGLDNPAEFALTKRLTDLNIKIRESVRENDRLKEGLKAGTLKGDEGVSAEASVKGFDARLAALSKERDELRKLLSDRRNAEAALSKEKTKQERNESVINQLVQARAILQKQENDRQKEAVKQSKARAKSIYDALLSHKKVNDAAEEQIRLQNQAIYLQGVELQYGKDSAEYKRAAAKHERENLALKLEQAGVDDSHIQSLLLGNMALEAGLKLLEAQRDVTFSMFEGSDAAKRMRKYAGRGTPTGTGEPSTKSTKEPVVKESDLEKLRYQVALETELLGKTEARQKVIQAIGITVDDSFPKTAAGLEEQINKNLELVRVEQERIDLANTIGSAMEDSLMSMVDGTKSVKDAFRDMAADIVRHLYKVLVVQQMINSFGGMLSGSSNPILKTLGGGLESYGSMDGGGYTGNGPRSGGLDGKGGFMMMMHPRETVVDHTKGQQANTNGPTIVQNFNFSANGDDSVKKIIAQAAPQIAQMTKNSMLNDRRRGGTTKAVFG